jgi:hypothetical protein
MGCPHFAHSRLEDPDWLLETLSELRLCCARGSGGGNSPSSDFRLVNDRIVGSAGGIRGEWPPLLYELSRGLPPDCLSEEYFLDDISIIVNKVWLERYQTPSMFPGKLKSRSENPARPSPHNCVTPPREANGHAGPK